MSTTIKRSAKEIQNYNQAEGQNAIYEINTSNRKAMNRNWSKQKPNPALITKIWREKKQIGTTYILTTSTYGRPSGH